ncbi:MAG: DotU family type IV/VI secretion system protein [Bryobacteraceae bacterium]
MTPIAIGDAGQWPGEGLAQRRAENLAYLLQEILTVIVRLRSGRQAVPDAEVFRAQMREALRQVDQQARLRGYSAEYVNLAIFAIVALLDETILTTRNPVFAQWARKPMQEELFGHHVAGEIFFQHVQSLLGVKDSQELADLLEVYSLCLLLGFAGRYGAGGRAELRSVSQAVAEKIRRIRGSDTGFSPAWMPPAEAAQPGGPDPWVRRLAYAAAGGLVLAVALFVLFKLLLSSGAGELAGLLA